MELRPCKVLLNGRTNWDDALFHKWTFDSFGDLAMVELRCGNIRHVRPNNIVFVDSNDHFDMILGRDE